MEMREIDREYTRMWTFGGVVDIKDDDYPIISPDARMSIKMRYVDCMKIGEDTRVFGRRIPYVEDRHWIMVPNVGIFFRDGKVIFYDSRKCPRYAEEVDLAESLRYIMDSECWVSASPECQDPYEDDLIQIKDSIEKVNGAIADAIGPMLESYYRAMPALKAALDEAMADLERKGLVRRKGKGWEAVSDEGQDGAGDRRSA